MSISSTALLSSLEEIRSFLELEDSRDEDLLETFINGASEEIEAKTHRAFVNRTYTDLVISGNGRERIRLPHYPIVSITSLTVGRTGPTSWGSVRDSDSYEWDETEPEEGILYLTDGSVFDRGSRNIKITYSAGYYRLASEGTPVIPDDLRNLALALACFLYKKRSAPGEEVTVRTFQGITEKVSNMFWTPERQAVADRYRRI